MSTQQVIGVIQTARQELESVLSSPLGIENYREDISKECNVAADLLKELKEAEARNDELLAKRGGVKDLPNKVSVVPFTCDH